MFFRKKGLDVENMEGKEIGQDHSSPPEASDKDHQAAEKVVNFIVAEMRDGHTRSEIINKIVEQGIDKAIADEMVGSIYPIIVQRVMRESYTSAALIPALIAGTMSAIIGGMLWGKIAIKTGYEIGFVAWGIGVVCGYAVVKATQGKKGLPLQMIAAIASLIGILIGKYDVFYDGLKQYAFEAGGPEAVVMMSPFSIQGIGSFIKNLGAFSGYDILWIGLAVWSAWKISAGMGIEAESLDPMDVPLET
jgi:hypothetical protein